MAPNCLKQGDGSEAIGLDMQQQVLGRLIQQLAKIVDAQANQSYRIPNYESEYLWRKSRRPFWYPSRPRTNIMHGGRSTMQLGNCAASGCCDRARLPHAE